MTEPEAALPLEPEPDPESDPKAGRPRRRRARPIRFERLILLAAIIGLGGGAVAAAYYGVLHLLLTTLWGESYAFGETTTPGGLAGHVPVWVVTGLGGLVVGVLLRWLGSPGEIAAVVDNIHLRRGRIDPAQTPGMTAVSLASISAGGSAGPEAPLVQIIGSGASWLGDRLGLYGSHVRTLTFCGMAAALGAFFGAPLGGALFALEIPHRRGLEYYEALVPALVSAGLAFVVFRTLTGIDGVLYHLPAFQGASLLTVGQGIGIGVAGAAAGAAFIALFRAMGRVAHRWERHVVPMAVAGGVAIGLIEGAVPDGLGITTLFWSEFQIRQVLAVAGGAAGTALPAVLGTLVAVAVAKALAIGFTLHSGFRGGFIFPLFFIGAALGVALSLASGGFVPPTVAALCAMAAVNVAVTKTPVSTTIILTTLSGTSMLPVIGAASMASFLLTTRVALIPTQRSRRR